MKRLVVILFILPLMMACSTTSPQIQPEIENDDNYFLISLPKESWQSHFPDLDGEVNIFRVNQDGSELQSVVTGLNGYNYVLSLSPDTRKFLVASYDLSKPSLPGLPGKLYVFEIDGSKQILLSEEYPFYPSPAASGALWLSESQVAYISGQFGKTQIYTIDSDGQNKVSRAILNRANPMLTPFRLLAFQEDIGLYWQNGRINTDSAAIANNPNRAKLDGSNLVKIDTLDGSKVPYWEIASEGNLIAWGNEIMTHDFELVDRLDLSFEPKLFFWSKNGERLLIQTCETTCSDQVIYQIWEQNTRQLRGAQIFAVKDLNAVLQKNRAIMWAVWSPDQTQIFVHLREYEDDNEGVYLQLFNVETLKASPVFEELYIDTTWPFHIQWLPREE